MPRLVRSRLETRTARLRLPQRKAPFWVILERGVAMRYHRSVKGGDGTWWGRKWADGRYRVESLATADDHQDADGITSLDWAQAQARVREWAGRARPTARRYTVALACADYVSDLRAHRAVWLPGMQNDGSRGISCLCSAHDL